MLQLNIEGLAALGNALAQLPDNLSKKYLRKATYAATAVIRDDAEGRAPVRTGNMQANISIFKRTDAPDTAHYAVGVRKIRTNKKIRRVFRIMRRAGVNPHAHIAGDAYYWRFVELGTEKMPAHPFLRPAFEAQKENAVEVFRQSLADGVQKAAAEVSATTT